MLKKQSVQSERPETAMNVPNQEIRNQFLAQACRYLFGPNANFASFSSGLGLAVLQPVAVRSDTNRR
jgi:hypothetical protein